MIKVQTIIAGAYQENCYLVYDDKSLIIIDPGAKFRKLSEVIDLLEKKVEAILLTHGHFDHTGATDQLADKYHCPIYGSFDDEYLFTHDGVGLNIKNKINWLKQSSITFGAIKVNIFYTPGHSSGSVMYLIDDKLFSGDTLFRLSVGRTDLYGGSNNQLMQSLNILNNLDPNIIVYPGHDEMTTIGFELDNNPYLR